MNMFVQNKYRDMYKKLYKNAHSLCRKMNNPNDQGVVSIKKLGNTGLGSRPLTLCTDDGTHAS